MSKSKFYYILNKPGSNPTTVRMFQQACDERSIEMVPIYSSEYDLTSLPSFASGDMLYRISTDRKSASLYKLCAATHRKLATIHKDDDPLKASGDNVWHASMTHFVNDVPIIKTVFDLTRNRQLLDSYVDYLGGYPVILKSSGGSHGIGVMRVDSKESLYSIADTMATPGNSFIMRQYIPHDISARLIVLGDEVVASVAYEKVAGDFRTNAGKDLNVYPKKFSDEIEQIAVKATQLLGAELGGVDVLIDAHGQPHLAEVNTPCFFPRTQEKTGIDIAGMLVDHLVSKHGDVRE